MAHLGNTIVNGILRVIGGINTTTINGVEVGSSPKFTDNNTTYSFSNGTNGFTVTPSGGSAISVTVTPSITNNVTGSGTSGYIAKWNGSNTITNGPAFSSAISSQSQSTKFLREDGTWQAPSYTANNYSNYLPTTTKYAASSSVGGSASSLAGLSLSTTTNLGVDNTTVTQQIGYVSGLTKADWNSQQTDGALYKQTYSDKWSHMIFGDYRTGHLAVRGRNNGSFTTWYNVLDTGNYTTWVTPANIGAASSGHNHDGVYAAASHGNHVPTTGTANNATFLRNDNTWQVVTPANIGAAASNHTHTASDVGAASSSHGHKITIGSGKKSDGSTDISATSSSSSSTPSVTLGDSGVTAGSYGDSGNQTPGYGSTFKVPYVQVNAKGIVVGISEHTVKIPASDNTNTDTKVTQAYSTSNANYPLLMTATSGTSSTSSRGDTTAILNNAIYANPSTGYFYATRVYNAVWNADYAEGFLYKGKKPEVGEIVELAGDGKIQLSTSGSAKTIGVVSDTYCLIGGANKELLEKGEMVAVGMLGKIKTKVIGKVKTGDRILAGNNGIGFTTPLWRSYEGCNVVGIAAEDNDDSGEKLVLCIIK